MQNYQSFQTRTELLMNKMGPKSLSNLFTYKGEVTNFGEHFNTNNMKKVSCMTEHTFGILFLKKYERANPFLPFERKSLLTLIETENIDVNIPVSRLLL